jgi:hypothetical protein
MRISLKRRSKRLTETSAIFLALLIGAGVYTLTIYGSPMLWIGIYAMAVSVAGLVISTIHEQLLVQIDARGIYDRGLGVGKIFWKDIENVILTTTNERHYLGLRIRQPERYLRRLYGTKRSTTLFRQGLGLNRFNVDISEVDIDPVDLKRLVDLKLQQNAPSIRRRSPRRTFLP